MNILRLYLGQVHGEMMDVRPLLEFATKPSGLMDESETRRKWWSVAMPKLTQTVIMNNLRVNEESEYQTGLELMRRMWRNVVRFEATWSGRYWLIRWVCEELVAIGLAVCPELAKYDHDLGKLSIVGEIPRKFECLSVWELMEQSQNIESGVYRGVACCYRRLKEMMQQIGDGIVGTGKKKRREFPAFCQVTESDEMAEFPSLNDVSSRKGLEYVLAERNARLRNIFEDAWQVVDMFIQFWEANGVHMQKTGLKNKRLLMHDVERLSGMGPKLSIPVYRKSSEDSVLWENYLRATCNTDIKVTDYDHEELSGLLQVLRGYARKMIEYMQIAAGLIGMARKTKTGNKIGDCSSDVISADSKVHAKKMSDLFDKCKAFCETHWYVSKFDWIRMENTELVQKLDIDVEDLGVWLAKEIGHDIWPRMKPEGRNSGEVFTPAGYVNVTMVDAVKAEIWKMKSEVSRLTVDIAVMQYSMFLLGLDKEAGEKVRWQKSDGSEPLTCVLEAIGYMRVDSDSVGADEMRRVLKSLESCVMAPLLDLGIQAVPIISKKEEDVSVAARAKYVKASVPRSPSPLTVGSTVRNSELQWEVKFLHLRCEFETLIERMHRPETTKMMCDISCNKIKTNADWSRLRYEMVALDYALKKFMWIISGEVFDDMFGELADVEASYEMMASYDMDQENAWLDKQYRHNWQVVGVIRKMMENEERLRMSCEQKRQYVLEDVAEIAHTAKIDMMSVAEVMAEKQAVELLRLPPAEAEPQPTSFKAKVSNLEKTHNTIIKKMCNRLLMDDSLFDSVNHKDDMNNRLKSMNANFRKLLMVIHEEYCRDVVGDNVDASACSDQYQLAMAFVRLFNRLMLCNYVDCQTDEFLWVDAMPLRLEPAPVFG
jgi:hypothetical protein